MDSQDIVAKVLKTAIYDDGSPEIPVFTVGHESELENSGWSLLLDSISDFSRLYKLSPGESFLEDIQTQLESNKPDKLILLPPFMGSAHLSQDLRNKFSQQSLESIAFTQVIQLLPENSICAAVLPAPLRRGKASVSINASLLYYIELGEYSNLLTSSAACVRFNFNVVIVKVGISNQKVARFFKFPDSNKEISQDEIIQDFKKLKNQNGGKTTHGYVHQGTVTLNEEICYEKYSPEQIAFQESINLSIEKYGTVQQLSDWGQIHVHRNRRDQNSENTSENRQQDISIVNGSSILENGHMSPDCSPRSNGIQYLKLEAGDICIPTITLIKSSLKCAEVKPDMLPLVAASTVLVIRLNSTINSEQRNLFLAYLASEIVAGWLKIHTSTIHTIHMSTLERYYRITPSILNTLPVPEFDEDLVIAVRSLNEAAEQFSAWEKSTISARSALFEMDKGKDSRLFILSTGREARQRCETAKLIDDLDYRIRTRLPHPISLRWRTLNSSHSNLEGYVEALECVEIIMCYIAHIAILLARHQNIPISYIQKNMADQLQRHRGTTFGNWVEILTEVNSENFRNQLQDVKHVPFYEVLTFLDQEADDVLEKLRGFRNDQAHQKGPKGAEVSFAYDKVFQDLGIILRKSEFLSEYPLRYIETTRVDSIERKTIYSYRDLMGDHPLVPIHEESSNQLDLEARSLYLRDRDGSLYLFRPLITRLQCPLCNSWETFYLDSYEDDGTVVLKSMERGHQLKDKSMFSAFKHVGLLKRLKSARNGNTKNS